MTDNKLGYNILESAITKMYIKTADKEQIKHIKDCCIQLNGSEDIVDCISKHSYEQFIGLKELDLEEIQLLDLIYEAMLDWDFTEEFEELETALISKNIHIRDSQIHGDSGMPIIGCYYNFDKNKWILERPVERSNRVYSEEFDTFNNLRNYLIK